MKKLVKRKLAILLSIIMCFAMTNVAFAAEKENSFVTTEETNEAEYSTGRALSSPVFTVTHTDFANSSLSQAQTIVPSSNVTTWNATICSANGQDANVMCIIIKPDGTYVDTISLKEGSSQGSVKKLYKDSSYKVYFVSSASVSMAIICFRK